MSLARVTSRVSAVVSVLVALVLVVALSPAAFAQVDPRILGTWKLNLTKSSFDPGPPPTSMTVTREQVGDAVRYTIERIEADGTRRIVVEAPKYDGKDYPRRVKDDPSLGAPYPDTIALTRIDAQTVEETLKRAGRVVETARQVVSPDGRLITTTVTGTNARGQFVHTVLVYDKQ